MTPVLKPSVLLSLLLSVAPCASAAAPADPVVSVSGGRIRGSLVPPGGAAFKGIPFAAPPLGNLRWREPAPVVAWSGVRDANSFGASCVQEISTWNKQEATGNGEDCLYLNVWTSEWPSRAKQPVMVWIHGGGNTGGGASVDYFDGVSLSRRGVVLVTLNYRLGLFGFFVHPGLTAESPTHSSGNYALLDQLAALKWVRDNIARFGGDPDNVTVFGQSAGGGNVAFLLASPLTAGLFHRAIQQSGTAIRNMATLPDAEKAGEAFAVSLKAPSGIAGIQFLRALPAEQLQQASVAARGANGPNIDAAIDGWFMPASAGQIFAAGKQHAVPLLIGSNAQEQRGPAPEALRKTVTDAFGKNAQQALNFYGLTGDGDGNDDPLYGPASMQLSADGRQRCGTVQQAIWHTALKRPVYEYQFDRAIPGRPATQHSAELSYLFGNLLPGGFLGGPYTDVDRKISNDLQVYWANFAKTGDPNGAGLPKWPGFDSSTRAFLEFTDNGPVAREGLRRQICDLYMENLQHAMTVMPPGKFPASR
jgi:para-nitrobenzyl esterase